MTKDEFENMIAAYGANADRWPEERRLAAQHYLNTNPDAQTLAQREAELDRVLDYAEVDDPSDILRARILKAAAPQINQSATATPRQHWKIAASFAAVLALGGFAYSAYKTSTQAATEDDSAIWLEAANDLGVSDIYDWVEGRE